MPVKVTTGWLRDFVDFDLSPDEVAEKLSFIGLAVESIERLPEGDAVLELDVTSNRGDCWSVSGVARELAAVLGLPLKTPELLDRTEGEPIRVEVLDPDLCPRYTARALTGVKIGPSPEWMQRRLEAVGIRPISNVVDITNYVMVEYGQPLHAFDRKLLKEDRIVVRRAKAGEPVELLDGTSRRLESEDLVIADASRPVALAGIMGAANTEINEVTAEVVLESAEFTQVATRKTRKRLGVLTESSARFEHGVDPVGVETASRRAAWLIREHAGAAVLPGVTDSNPSPELPGPITLRAESIERLLGVPIPEKDVRRILAALGFGPAGGNAWRPPSWRHDMAVEVDLIEEVARIYGYERLRGRSTMRVFPVQPNEAWAARGRSRDVLVALGYQEIWGASFFSPERVRLTGPAGHEVLNPVRAGEGALRTNLAVSVLAAKLGNQNAGNSRVRVFEAGSVCLPGTEMPVDKLAVLDDGREGENDETAFLIVKGALERVARELGGLEIRFEPPSADEALPGLDSARSAVVRTAEGGAKVGAVGIVSDEAVSAWGLRTRPVLAEVELMPLVSRRAVQALPLPRYPAIARDVALVVDESVRWADLVAAASGIAGEWRSEPEFQSVFRGKQLGAGRKSVAFRVEYRSPERTLSDDEIKTPHEEFVSRLVAELGAELRK